LWRTRRLSAKSDQVASELAAARTEQARLGARISGLEAQLAALGTALARGARVTAVTGAAPRYRTDAIVAVVEGGRGEMTIQHVIVALSSAGRPGETYDNIGVDLAYLAERGRVNRIRRGVYGPAAG
jgi:transcriptional accessory protein Tex/SPT6